MLECHFSYEGSLSGHQLYFGFLMGKHWENIGTWTAILAEIFSPVSPQEIFWHQDLREHETEVERKRHKNTQRKR